MLSKLLNQIFSNPNILLNDGARLEKAARKLCRLRGINPDANSEIIISEQGNAVIIPVWKVAEKEIKTFLQVQIAIEDD